MPKISIEEIIKLNLDIEDEEKTKNDDIKFFKSLLKILGLKDSINTDIFIEQDTLTIIETNYKNLTVNTLKTYMTKIIKYLKLLEIDESIIELYYKLYVNMIKNNNTNKIKNEQYKKIYESADIDLSYIKIYAYFKANLTIYFGLSDLVNLQFIKNKATNNYIDFFLNIIEIQHISTTKITKLADRKTEIIKLSEKHSKKILQLLLHYKNKDEIEEIKKNKDTLQNELESFKCKYLIQRKNKQMTVEQIDDAYQNFNKKY